MEQNEEQRKGQAEARSRIYRSTHHASEVKSIPDTAHFAILVNETYTQDDGYNGSSYSNYLQYVFFDNDEALQAWIIENHLKKTYKVISVKPVEVELKTTITIKD